MNGFRRLLIVCALLSISVHTVVCAPLTDSQYLGQFATFVHKYDKTYLLGELDRRFHQFKDNVGFIMDFNSQNHTHTLGVNQFADVHESEWPQYKGFASDQLTASENMGDMLAAQAQLDPIPMLGDETDYVDWRTQGNVVNPVLNQGKCGSCYSYAAVSVMESAYAIKTGRLMQGSVQQPVDCCHHATLPCSTCNGGLMVPLFEWAKNSGGLCLESSYPYVARQGPCQTCSKILKQGGHYNLRGLPESYIRKAIKVNPVSVGLMSNTRSFMFYRGGVITSKCGTKADHAVVVVGLEKTNDNVDSYIIRNSWGPNWGEQGHLRVQYGKNMCGILLHPSYPAPPTDEQLNQA